MSKFETELIELIDAARERGISWDDIIAAMKMQMVSAHEMKAKGK